MVFVEKLSLVINSLDPLSVKSDFSRVYVPDCVIEGKTRVILVLESPHTQEVKQGFPLAGNSGKEVSKLLDKLIFQQDSPLNRPVGAYISEKYPLFQGIGLLNICPIPMQTVCYDPVLQERYGSWLRCLAILRGAPSSKKRKDPQLQTLETMILADLKERIEQAGSETLLIPCGNVARAFLDKAGIQTEMNLVPHPSFGQWSRAGNLKILQNMTDQIVKALNSPVSGAHGAG
ncbi:MAG: hypothetical protein HQM11_05660 [SAR324 cluster bacterium]|nr:hypothetical protein [SAR324 cluster bacterium]